MFSPIVAPFLGVLFISLALINLSTNINPSLHSFMVFILIKKTLIFVQFSLNQHDHFQQIQENLPIKYLRDIPTNQLQRIFSIYLLICGVFIIICEGLFDKTKLCILIVLFRIKTFNISNTFICNLNLYNSINNNLWFNIIKSSYLYVFICLYNDYFI